jgi:hypothetical protein
VSHRPLLTRRGRADPEAESALKSYAPNLGYDMGGRLTAAWLDR